MRIFNDRRGSALLLSLLLLLILSVCVAAGFRRVSAERRVNGDMVAQVDAYTVAMSGLQQYMANVTSAPGATVVDSVTGLAGGKSYINIWKLRSAVGTTVPALYVISSRGVNTTASKYDASAVAAERTVAQYALWLPASFQVSSAWTSITGLHKNGGSGTISGTDNCGVASAVGGVAVPTTAADGGAGYSQSGGSSVPAGSPPIANLGANSAAAANSVPVNWNGIINGSAITPTVTITSGTTGWPSSFPTGSWPTIIVKEGSTTDFSLPSDGQGMLIVQGNVTISGSKQWKGIIMVGGTLTSNGNNTVLGAVVTGLNVKLGQTVGTSDVGNGTKTYKYDSCNVANALSNFASFTALRNGLVDNWPTY
jgi:hypothetical protein